MIKSNTSSRAIGFDVKLHVIDVTDVATLRKIGADAGTFLADYTITQQWAKQLMEHPADLDGFFYSSRLGSGRRSIRDLTS